MEKLSCHEQVTRRVWYIVDWSWCSHSSRMAYFPLEQELILYSPLLCHEQIISDFHVAFTSTMHSMPINNRLIKLDVFGNNAFRSQCIHAIPDFQVVFQCFSSNGINHTPMVLWVGECTFTQNHKTAEQKLKLFVSANPEIEVAFLITMSKASSFERPLPRSAAAKALRKQEVQDLAIFLSCYSDTESFGLVVVKGHTWIHITEITWKVWIKGSSSSIDFDNTNPDLFAKGVSKQSLYMNS